MVARNGEVQILKLTEKDGCKPWSSAVDPIDRSFFPDLYDWHRPKGFSGSAVVQTSKANCE
jgi:hypothetical protein